MRFIINTAIIPVAMNVNVAKIDRIENLEMPQTPCPEVHPLPKRDPKPIKNPPMINHRVDRVVKILGVPNTCFAMKAPRMRPTKSKILQKTSPF